MYQKIERLSVNPRGAGLMEITEKIQKLLQNSNIHTGLLTLYCTHTSASLLIQENADHDVQTDLLAFFRRLVPEGDPLFVHRLEGPDDMPAHIKSALTQTSLSIPIEDGQLTLGSWQGIYLFEHRLKPQTRKIIVHMMGEE